MIADEAGQTAAAPDGDIVMEDGSTITIKDGMITAIVPADGEAVEEEKEETKLSKLEAQIAKLEIAKEIARHKDEIEQLKAKQSSLCSQEDLNKVVTELAAQREFNKELFAFVEKISELPSGESKVIEKKDGFKEVKKGSMKDLAAQARAISAEFKSINRN
jgi:hypothetical protein